MPTIMYRRKIETYSKKQDTVKSLMRKGYSYKQAKREVY